MRFVFCDPVSLVRHARVYAPPPPHIHLTQCGQPTTKADLITLNPSLEESQEQAARLLARRSRKRDKKDKDKDKKPSASTSSGAKRPAPGPHRGAPRQKISKSTVSTAELAEAARIQ